MERRKNQNEKPEKDEIQSLCIPAGYDKNDTFPYRISLAGCRNQCLSADGAGACDRGLRDPGGRGIGRRAGRPYGLSAPYPIAWDSGFQADDTICLKPGQRIGAEPFKDRVKEPVHEEAGGASIQVHRGQPVLRIDIPCLRRGRGPFLGGLPNGL